MSAMSSSAAPPIVIQNVAVNAVVAAATNAIESQLSHLSDLANLAVHRISFGHNFGNSKRRFFAIYAKSI